MAGLEHLIPYIYHEKQQSGSMLCAQHALNSLLQGNYFTAPDLSDIARTLDALEESYDHSNTGSSSTNMDDTGFFSIQVLDNALKVWGLNLTRWRGEEMRSYQDHPQTQLAFILNLDQHWFTLRRFGNANADIDMDDGNGHWFNLNSFLTTPEWVGKLYLGMVLQQAETEGYSVFAVTQADPEAPLALPRTEVDTLLSTLPEPTSSSNTHFQTPPLEAYNDLTKKTLEGSGSGHINIEDEDYELQAALQASLMGAEEARTDSQSRDGDPYFSPRLEPVEPAPSGYDSGSQTPQFVRPSNNNTTLPEDADLDPVAASMERNRFLLQRVREQQEHAQREVWSDLDLTPEEQTALEGRRERRRMQEEEEEEELRRAIEESKAFANKQPLERVTIPTVETDHWGINPLTSAHDEKDADLQAALKASLEHSLLPPSKDSSDAESIVSDNTNLLEESSNTPGPSLDEIRQRRLARFGH